jgi:transposase
VNTEHSTETSGRRRRRLHSAQFKAELVQACRGTGVSIAAVALAHGVNANLLRRWVNEAERGGTAVTVRPPAPRSMPTPAFVPLKVEQPAVPQDIHIELQRGTTTVTVSWPAAAAAECAAWMRELLR